MKLKPILVGLILLMYLSLPVLAADGAGEENVTLTQKDGSVVSVKDKKIGIEKSDTTKSSDNSDSSSNDTKSDNAGNIDVWGIQQNSMSLTNYADLVFLGRIYSGITPLRNVSILGVAVSFGLSFTVILAGAFILVFLAGVGGIHPNTKRGMDMISGARGRLLAIFGVFFLALLLIVLTFFFLAVFQKISLFVA